eukprot:SM000018S03590  [mRNA]  locus=s18:91243:92345:- [translate_table: standard]
MAAAAPSQSSCARMATRAGSPRRPPPRACAPRLTAARSRPPTARAWRRALPARPPFSSRWRPWRPATSTCGAALWALTMTAAASVRLPAPAPSLVALPPYSLCCARRQTLQHGLTGAQCNGRSLPLGSGSPGMLISRKRFLTPWRGKMSSLGI